MPFPVNRGRRLRRTPRLRSWVAETRLSPQAMVQPLFICSGKGVDRPIDSLPGQSQLSPDMAAKRAARLAEAGIGAVLLFGIPDDKDPVGSSSLDPRGVVPQAIRAIKRQVKDLIVIADVCLCEFTDHAHCGVLTEPDAAGHMEVDNDPTLEILAQQSVVFAESGCDVIAPSAMADGQVDAIRVGLDEGGFLETPILAYSAKYASAFYGPFRDAAENTPAFGDRRSYQMDPANSREALREAELDIEEGADIIMVKPALPYLDIVAQLRDAYDLPIAAYHVSGEYAMVEAAGEKGWLDADACQAESLACIHRAGADIIITYAAERAAKWMS